MTFVPHVRLSMNGTLPAGEIFSCNLSLVPQGDQWQTYLIGAWAGAAPQGAVNYSIANYVDDAQFQDIVDDVSAFWSREASLIHASAVLTRVKMASIGPEGTYGGAPIEKAVNVAGGFNLGAHLMPNQNARKVTLMTNGDLGRVKGGFYLPAVTDYQFDLATQLFSLESVDACRGSVATLVGDLNNGPGWDAEGWKVVVASQGRHNHDGTVRRPPTNHDVVGVRIGRRPDTQRRRANKVFEAPDAVVAIP